MPDHPDVPEQRTITAELQEVQTEGRTLTGFAALYGIESRDLGGFREIIERGAFGDVLAGEPDVYLTLNHSPDRVLARTASGTLRLRDEERGLAFEADLGDGPTAQDCREMVKRGDVSGASFRFKVATGGDRWEGERRTLTKIGELIDLSLATTPAYDGPRVELRSAPETETEIASTDAHNEENEMEVEDRNEGGLAVEDRSAADEPSIESRVIEAVRSIRPGESRALTDANVGDGIAKPELSSYIWDKLRPMSIALASGITVLATDRESVVWPRITADVDPTWTGEAELIPAGDPGFGTLTATPRKLAHRVEMSNELVDDSEPSIIEVLNQHLAVMLALKLDASIFTGNPTADDDSIRGLKYVTGTQVISMGTNGDSFDNLDPFVEAIGLLMAANVAPPYAVALSPRTWTDLSTIKEETGSNKSLLMGEPSILGHPVFASSQLPVNETAGTASDSSTAYVFAPRELVLVRRQDAIIELDRSRLFDTDQSELRAKLRADLIVPNPTAVVKITGITPAA